MYEATFSPARRLNCPFACNLVKVCTNSLKTQQNFSSSYLHAKESGPQSDLSESAGGLTRAENTLLCTCVHTETKNTYKKQFCSISHCNILQILKFIFTLKNQTAFAANVIEIHVAT